MNIILLSGGSGQRLWPLSNDIRSKQFIKLFKDENGQYASMVQRIYKQVKAIDRDAVITIATSQSQVSAIRNQLGEDVGISIEPCRRDTFPAIALATAYLHDVKKVDENEAVVVCPVDPYVDDDYFATLKDLCKLAESGESNLNLLGMEPTYPSEKFGYIIPAAHSKVSEVKTFKEKPTTDVAKQYISEGALWNGGVFAYKLKYVLDKAHELIDFEDYEDLFEKYPTLEKISFDYAVVEKEDSISVMRFGGQWKDLGTWNALSETLNEKSIGKAILDEECEDVQVINELDIPVICLGQKDNIIVSGPQGILVSTKERTDFLKKYVEKLDQRIMFAEKSWGQFKVLSSDEESLTAELKISAGHGMSYHSHQNRNEIWTVLSGNGISCVEGLKKVVEPGTVISIEAGCKHMLYAKTDMKLVEVQLGKEIDENDKQVYEFEK